MKKVLSILLAVVLVLSFSFSAMALKSKGGTELHQVVINRTNTGMSSAKAETQIVVKGNSIKVVPVTPNKQLTFNGISLYTDQAATKPAVIGKDFEIVEVTFKDSGAKAELNVDYKIEETTGKIISLKGDLLTVEVKPLKDNLFISESFSTPEGNPIKEEFNEVTILEGVLGEETKKDPTSPNTADNYNTSVIVVLCIMILGAGVVAVASKRSFN